MKCPECVKQNQKSIIKIIDKGFATLMGVDAFYDENGKYHYHNSNSTHKTMFCSNNHVLKVITYQRCIICDWQVSENIIEVV